jgi:helix-turn-helix protein
LSNSERLQKLYDGTIEKELIKTYDKNKNDLYITSSLYKKNNKNQINPFLGLSNSERLQKLYDGTIEKELIKTYDKNKNILNITPSLFNPNIKDGCFKTKNINFLKGLSNSERLQKLYDGSLEREYIRLNP